MKKIYQNSISQMFAHLSMGKHLRIVTLAYNSLFVAHVFGKQPRALRQAIVMSVAVVLIGFSCNWQLISGPGLPVMTNDGHALQSFEIAVNRVACGTLSSISEGLVSENWLKKIPILLTRRFYRSRKLLRELRRLIVKIQLHF
jgi:hypothetical protein